MIQKAVRNALRIQGLERRLAAPGARVPVQSLPGAAPAALAAALADEGRRSGEDRGPVVLVAPTPNEADLLHADAAFLLGTERSRSFPQREALPYEDSDPHVEVSGQRVETLAALLAGRAPLLITTARALAERSRLPTGPSRPFALSLATGATVRLENLAGRLAELGFEAVHTVREVGEFAVRGGIVDLFPYGQPPVRIELWGDEIVSLRHFDLLTQRSVDRVEEVEVLPVTLDLVADGEPGTERRALVELLPAGSRLLELDPSAGVRLRREMWEETREARRGAGRTALPVESLLLPPEEAESRLAALRRMWPEEEGLDLGLSPAPAVDRQMERLVGIVAASRREGERVVILCDNEGQLERLEEILVERGGRRVADAVVLAIGSLSGGFRSHGPEPLLLLTDHEIFLRSHRLRPARRRYRGAATLESIASIRPGDYVVHMDHGIGRYQGVARVTVGGETIETLKIEYADGEVLRLPHYRLDLIERWSTLDAGEEAAEPPRVHRLGGKGWKRLKARTIASIEETAQELLHLYAERRIAEGHPFGPSTTWQREMEAAFLYEETRDQRIAWGEVQADMESVRPMDRLVCGDVGFGKTEIAMRAAFKAVQDGKQVALLAPTTILAEQHLHTFRERLAAFPVRVEGLSRFRTPAEQREVVDGLASGVVDVVIGTHRLLSADVAFRDLGLLIVDEEQRFGVRQKERLKQLRRSVDVLTLTATPIPRTLQMAIGSLRDLSRMESAPRDRMPIITHVLRWDDGIIEDAMRRELDRGGQVFFVHDRVETIDSLAARVSRLVPEARVGVAHGRMPESELEETMADLMSGRVRVLVCTSIIENGLDVPNANTMVVHRADRFGLAQLYQLRGRVGRSHRRAYCYLLVPPEVTPEAERRLRVLKHHTELGSGYQVALKDLQLRGAGNLLGAEQSGFATAVGLETYQRLVEATVRKLSGEAHETRGEVTHVSLAGEAYLPDGYILDPEQKIHLYRRLSRVQELQEVENLREELRDRFGPLPEPAERLLASAELRVLGSGIEAAWIRVSGEAARITFQADAVPRLARLRNAMSDRQIRVEVGRLEPLSLVLHRAGAEPLLPTLVAALRLLSVPSVGKVAAASGGRRE
ncbi:MAG: transcription-repair coupling factor [Gemmatimonadota bacterium]